MLIFNIPLFCFFAMKHMLYMDYSKTRLTQSPNLVSLFLFEADVAPKQK